MGYFSRLLLEALTIIEFVFDTRGVQEVPTLPIAMPVTALSDELADDSAIVYSSNLIAISLGEHATNCDPGGSDS